MFALALAIGVTALHQQATVKAHSLMTIFTGIKADLQIYKVKHSKDLGMYKFMKMS